MPILVGIDGTGSAIAPGAERDQQYDIDFADSFVRRIADTGSANFRYFRGPVMLGGGLVDAINGGFDFIRARRRVHAEMPVLLTGYSRGAAGVVSLAGRLKRAGIDVEALLLFDCVDRHLFIDAEVIPNNVANVMHVIRDPRSGSRESFNNDGMSYRPPTNYPAAYMFMCTHGGMGGCPWDPEDGQTMADTIDEGGIDGETNITFQQDHNVSRTVWTFCQSYMTTYGFR